MMKQSEITATLANRLDWSGPKVNELLQLTTEVMGEYLSDPGRLLLPGLGELVSQKISEYISYDPVTDKRYLIPPSVRLQFKVAPRLEGEIEVDHLVSLVNKQHPDRSSDDISRLLKEWISLQRELLLEQKSAETETFGVFNCQLIGKEEHAHGEGTEHNNFLKYKIEFNPSETFQNLVNNNFIHFEPSLLNPGVVFNELRTVKVGDKVMDDEYDNVIIIEEFDEEDEVQQKNAALEPDEEILPQSASDLKPKKRSSILIPVLGGLGFAIVALLFKGRKSK